MIEAGIIDPTKVVKTALVDASSVASLMITTEAVIYDAPEDKKSGSSAASGGMGGMDMYWGKWVYNYYLVYMINIKRI